MLSLKKINDFVVSKIPQMGGEQEDKRPIKGAQLFPEIYANIYICSKKKSGKSTLIFNIIKNCCTTETNIVAFVSTLNKDQGWINTKKWCEKVGIPFVGYTSIIDDNGINKLHELIFMLQKKAEVEEMEKLNKNKKVKSGKNRVIMCEDDSDDEEPVRRQKFRAPEYMIILDDLSDELSNVTKLLKENRHYLSKVIISSQYWNDTQKQGRRQIDYIILFKGMPIDKLKEIHKNVDLSTPFEIFERIYHFATKDLYNFLYIDTINEIYRKNFNITINPQNLISQ